MSSALVLGGGGPVGVAWEAGVLTGLAQAGVDLATADRIVGTSAGSIVGARLAVGDSLEQALAAAPPSTRTEVDPEALMAIGVGIFEALTGARPAAEVVAQLGAIAAEAETIDEEAFIAAVGMKALDQPWPDRDYRCTAYDIESGELTVWSRDSGVPLALAVTSSCAVPGIFPPITIDGRRYMDGGLVSGTNATLMRGADRVVVISVMSRAMPGATDLLRKGVDEEIAELRAGGSAVELIEFDDATVELVAGDLMSFTNREAVAAAGVAQGRAEAERIGAVWG